MSKTKSRPSRSRGRFGRWWAARCRQAAASKEPIDVVSQFQAARRQPWAAGLAGLIGGLPPFIGQAMAHGEVGMGGVSWWHDPKAIVVAGCMLFSMSTVYVFGRATFRDLKKALGFVAAMELAMVASGLWYIRLATLAVVVGVNMVMTGAGIALAYEAAERRREAEARRAQTRAETRAERRAGRRPVAQEPGKRGTVGVPGVPWSTAWEASTESCPTSALALRPSTRIAGRKPPIDVFAVELDDASLS